MRNSPYPLSFIRALHFGPTSNEEIYGPPSRNPVLGKAEITPERSPGIPRGAVWDRLTHCHSSHRRGTRRRNGDIFSRRALSNRVTSRGIWLFAMHRRF